MKNLIYGTVAILLSLFIVEACTKTGLPASNGQVVATKTNITVNALDSLTVVGSLPTDSVKWTVMPLGHNSIFTHLGNAFIRFTTAGTYTVSAVVNGGAPASIIITAADSVTTPADTTTKHITYIPLTGDQVTLYTHLQKGPVTDSVYLWFSGTTTKEYPCGNSELRFSNSLNASNNFTINFIDVMQPASCTTIKAPIPTRRLITFNQNNANPYMVNGTYPLVITLAGTTYTGSITVTATNVTFNWTYTAGVILTPKVLSR